MNSKEIFINACRQKPVPRPPVWLMRQVGRYQDKYQALRKRFSFIELIKKPGIAAEASLYVLEDFDPDAVIVFSDILTVLASMGAELSYDPKLSIKTDFNRLNLSPDESWLSPAWEALRILKDEVREEKALIGFAGAPYTLLYYLMGRGDEIRSILPLEEKKSLNLLEKIANIVALHLRMQAEAGADVLQIFDTSAGDLPPHLYRKFALEPLRILLGQLDDLDCPIILFARGRNLFESRDFLTGCVLSLDWTVSLDSIPDASALSVQGNLDPVVLLGGSKLTRRETENMLRSARLFGGYIANLGHGVLPKTPMASVQEFVKTVKNFSLRND